ncbi:LysR family transcriptional regulator [Burkholderia plantarii]|uniref:LysR family transcriptional regulator n=1 Tax=Burkholderia plantarii TaxID=41899 RepID=UPI0006D89862|nr:LysR family transcriptional regulator [Burkholderia plantarii]ALK34305.1 LysR family transcriptional regulator [Burkholderia plantarii]WLE63351.1 LysR family transcriptional regulator [Burkholderia plantarii]GLZ22088.1 LysR family transcriptional regulator [Burkholderia plantarii]
MDWNDLRYFLCVARTGSLSKASGDLGVSVSTVGRRILELEANLGATLFSRSQSGYVLTPEGERVLAGAEKVEAGIFAVERSAYGLVDTVSGTVRLATSENLATDLVIPALPAFRERYPLIRLQITTSTMTAELDSQEADIALRVVRPERGNLKIRRLGRMTYSVYGRRDYLEANPPAGRDPLQGRSFIAWDSAHDHLPAARWLARRAPDADLALVTSSLPTQLAAVRAGLGLAVIPDFLAVDEDLVQVLPPSQLFSNDVWLVVHPDISTSARVRAVGDFLADAVTKVSLDVAARGART